MKKIIIITLIILNLLIYVPAIAQSKKLILNGMTIVIDPGHGGKDVGSSFGDIYEKDINLSISLKLKKELESYGASVYLTREGDYDLSTPNASFRKKSDFDNRIKKINNLSTDLFISIHQNFFGIEKYNGIQIFYKDSLELAKFLQEKLNPDRESKKISNSLYMYNKIKSKGLLIECGFLSNANDRKKLSDEKYQKELTKNIAIAIKEYYFNK